MRSTRLRAQKESQRNIIGKDEKILSSSLSPAGTGDRWKTFGRSGRGHGCRSLRPSRRPAPVPGDGQCRGVGTRPGISLGEIGRLPQSGASGAGGASIRRSRPSPERLSVSISASASRPCASITAPSIRSIRRPTACWVPNCRT